MKAFVPITEYKSNSKSFNAALIDVNGSPTTTQIWEGGLKEVCKWIIEKINMSETRPQFYSRPVHVYIKSHLGGKPCLVNLEDKKHFAALKAIAAQQNQPTKETVCQTS